MPWTKIEDERYNMYNRVSSGSMIMNFVIPDEIFQTVALSEQELLQELALLLYQQERLTLGNASRLAKMHPYDFMQLMASRNVCIHYDVDDFEEDLRTLRALDHLKSTSAEPLPPRRWLKSSS
jgi:predicted HTH domain antitoxin